MNQKGFIQIVVILVILGLVGGTVFVSSKVKLPNISSQHESQTIPSFIPTDSATSNPKPTSNKNQNPVSNNQITTLNKTLPSPTPKPIQPTVKTGTLKGKVAGGYYLKILPGTVVTLKGSVTKTTNTDNDGVFTFTLVPVGAYNLSFSHPDYNISDLNNITVSEGETFYPRTINGFLKVFKPTTIKGTVYVDRNDNRQKDSGDEGLDALIELYNKIGDNSWHLYQTISADKSGNFSVQINDGSTYKLVPTNYTFYRKPAESAEFVVDGYGETREFSFPYYPLASSSKLTVYVFNDKNENSVQDVDEENIDYYYAEITNTATGKTEKTSVSPQGTYSTYNDYGPYQVKLIAGNDAWAQAYKITKSNGMAIIDNSSGDQTVKLGAHKLY